MMVKNKIYILAALLLLSLGLNAENVKQKINFARFLKAGDLFKCKISAQNKSSSIRKYKGKNEEIVKESITKIQLAGILLVKAVNKSGNSEKIEFEFESVTGELDGQPFRPEWSGKTLIADLTKKPVCEFRFKNETQPLAKKEIMMLSLVFRPVSEENMGDFIGTEKAVTVGDSWGIPQAPLMKIFTKQGLKLASENINGQVTLKSKEKYQGIDCWEIEEEFFIDNIPKFEYKFSVSMMLPVDDSMTNIKLIKKGITKIEKNLKNNHVMTAGIEKIILINSDEMTAEMIPGLIF